MRERGPYAKHTQLRAFAVIEDANGRITMPCEETRGDKEWSPDGASYATFCQAKPQRRVLRKLEHNLCRCHDLPALAVLLPWPRSEEARKQQVGQGKALSLDLPATSSYLESSKRGSRVPWATFRPANTCEVSPAALPFGGWRKDLVCGQSVCFHCRSIQCFDFPRTSSVISAFAATAATTNFVSSSAGSG